MRCVECGNAIPSIYKEYSKGNIRLTICTCCNNTADKYIEYETVLIYIDLLLYKPQVYRHIFYNREPFSYDKLVKTGMILSLLDLNMKAYLLEHRYCVYLADDSKYNSALVSSFQISQLSCHILIMAIIDNIVYLSIILAFVRFGWISSKWKDCHADDGYIKLLGSIYISSFGKLFIMLTVIWEYHPRVIHVIGAMVITSNLLALMIYLKSNLYPVALMVILALIGRGMVQWLLYYFGNSLLFYTLI